MSRGRINKLGKVKLKCPAFLSTSLLVRLAQSLSEVRFCETIVTLVHFNKAEITENKSTAR
jgi:hypothetical protein